MNLVVVLQGLVRNLDKVCRLRTPALKVGLFQEPILATEDTPLSALTPCDFSGYAGLQDIVNWTVPTLTGHVATTTADPVIWTFDGGVPRGWIAGYYVTDYDGELLWLANRTGGLAQLIKAGQSYEVFPIHSLRSRFGGD